MVSKSIGLYLQLLTLSLWPYVTNSQPLWWHNTKAKKGGLCTCKGFVVCGKGMMWEMYFLAFEYKLPHEYHVWLRHVLV